MNRFLKAAGSVLMIVLHFFAWVLLVEGALSDIAVVKIAAFVFIALTIWTTYKAALFLDDYVRDGERA